MPRNLREALRGRIPEDLLSKLRAFDIVGDIAVLRLPPELRPYAREIGEALMRVHRHVRAVLNQVSPVSGEFRTRQLEHVAGERRTITLHRENGCVFRVDLARVYFSPRLGTERLRVARLVRPGEVVTNLFAGVGCFSVEIARLADPARVYSIDINPAAYQLMLENIRLNRVGDRVLPFLGDCRQVVRTRLRGEADRVLMPLPELARQYLPVAFDALRPSGGVIHFYDYGREPDPFGPSAEYVAREARARGLRAEVLAARRVRSYAPRCYHVVLDLRIARHQPF
jgi:tRNA (guanine37-N1)-methyltransferase